MAGGSDLQRSLLFVLACCTAASPAWASGYASNVVRYTPGSGVDPGYDNPQVAIGEPTRFSGETLGFPGAVTPFNPAFEADEVVGVGAGGELVLEFADPVTDDPDNPFGIDLLVFGNSGHFDLDFPNGLAGPLFNGGDGGQVSVSADGQAWSVVPGVRADGLFATLSYSDLTDPYSLTRGLVPADAHKPVDPSFNPVGKTFAQIVAGYAGSAGGAGIDLADVGLTSIRFVRITTTSSVAAEIDAVADVRPVPGPASLGLASLASLGVATRRRKEINQR